MAYHGQIYTAEGKTEDTSPSMTEATMEKARKGEVQNKHMTDIGGQDNLGTGQTTQGKAEEAKEKTSRVMLQTGDKIKDMAGGATDTVKHAFGMAGSGGDDLLNADLKSRD
ncbi:hypothetical protein ACFE04_012726 [Oxalis oulophora]